MFVVGVFDVTCHSQSYCVYWCCIIHLLNRHYCRMRFFQNDLLQNADIVGGIDIQSKIGFILSSIEML